jgi:hypothetical protein
MTDRDMRVNVTTDARRAAEQISDLADEVREVEGTHQVDVDTNAERAEPEVDELRRKLDALTDEQRTIVFRAQAQQLDAELRRIDRSLSRIDRMTDEEVTLRLEARDNASRKLDEVRSELRQLDGDTATVKVEARGVDELADALDGLGGRAGNLGNVLSRVLADPRAGVGLLAGGLLLAGQHAANTAIEAGEIARLTGDSVDQASRLNAVFQSTGGEAKDLQDILLQNAGVLATNAELAARLNVDTTAPLIEQFRQVVRALGTEYPNAAERAVAASQLFGEEGVRQVNALLSMYGDLDSALAAVSDQQALDQDDVDRANEYRREMAELRAELNGFAQSVGSIVVPALGELVGFFNDGLEGAENFGRTIRGLFDGGEAQRNRDYVASIEAGLAAGREWAAVNGHLYTTVEEVSAAARDAGLEFESYSAAIATWGRQAASEAASAEAAFERSADGIAAALGLTTSAFEAAAAAARDNPIQLRDNLVEIVPAAEAAAEALDEVGDAYDRLRTPSTDSSLLDLADQFDQVRDAAREAAQAQAEGNADAERQARDYLRERIALHDAIVDYAEEVGGLSEAKVTRLLTLVDRGQLADAERLLNELTGDRYVKLNIDVAEALESAFKGVTFALPGGGKAPVQIDVPAPPPPTNVTVYNPPGSPTTVAAAEVRYGRRNATDFRGRIW